MRAALLWFKQDLRLDDNPALQAALDSDSLLPVYILDPRLLRPDRNQRCAQGVLRTQWLLQALHALDNALRQRGSALLVMQGEPEHVIASLAARLDIRDVHTQDEISPQAISQLRRTRTNLGPIALHVHPANSLLNAAQQNEVLNLPAVFSAFREYCARQSLSCQPRPAPIHLPSWPAGCEHLHEPLPTLADLGLSDPLTGPDLQAGEAAAQMHLREQFWADGEPAATRLESEQGTLLSPYVASGCLSVRRVASELRRHEGRNGRSVASQRLWQNLLWREFYRATLMRYAETLFATQGLNATAQAPTTCDERFVSWCNGRTGMPFVDAAMRELLARGVLQRSARQVAAAYLVHDLKQDWCRGAAWFAEHLIDYDEASNWGNWAFLAGASCSGRHQAALNTLRLAKLYDPMAHYISQWVPELRSVSSRLRHTPFLLPRTRLQQLRYPLLQNMPEAWRPYLPGLA